MPSPPAAPALVPATRTDLALDFANTRFWRGTDTPTETLHNLDEVIDWCGSNSAQRADAVRRMKAWWQQHPGPAAEAFAQSIALRETLQRILAAAATERAPAAGDLAQLNRALAAAPARTALSPIDGGYAWQVERLKPTVTHLLAAVLWSAGDLLAEPALTRVRQCNNEKCRWLFLDTSKTGNRRWCSMSMCGNRAKAQRHYQRQRAES
jgi:predicted RNA-binding Zn ribbon-like protein